MPVLESLLGGQRLTAEAAPYDGRQAALLSLDACLGVDGLPQSASGQAVLMTGVNIPAQLGYHYGPKPNKEVAEYVRDGNLFSRITAAGKKAALLNAYPPRYFEGIKSGKRLYSSIPLAVTSAGLPLFNHADYFAGKALSADFTGLGWRTMLGYQEAPLRSPHEAGVHLGKLSSGYDFSLFEYWASDYAGHKQNLAWACEQLEVFDGVLGGLLESTTDELFILITSDHGNMEDINTRRHTFARVPALLIGPQAQRQAFANGLTNLAGIAPAILAAIL